MKINILNKPGMLSAEDRKQPLSHPCEHFLFETCLDLSQPIKITAYGSYGQTISLTQYSRDVATFITWWSNNVMPDLNGFSGFHHVIFEPVGFMIR